MGWTQMVAHPRDAVFVFAVYLGIYGTVDPCVGRFRDKRVFPSEENHVPGLYVVEDFLKFERTDRNSALKHCKPDILGEKADAYVVYNSHIFHVHEDIRNVCKDVHDR